MKYLATFLFLVTALSACQKVSEPAPPHDNYAVGFVKLLDKSSECVQQASGYAYDAAICVIPAYHGIFFCKSGPLFSPICDKRADVVAK